MKPIQVSYTVKVAVSATDVNALEQAVLQGIRKAATALFEQLLQRVEA